MFEKIGSNFVFPSHIYDIEELENVPVVKHVYGQETVIPDSFCWMTYAGVNGGEISFSRNTGKFLPKVSAYVLEYLQDLTTVKLSPERVHFIRTRGFVNPHRDEANRKCCINIGLKNSSKATTKICLTENLEDFYTKHASFICEDGSAYLLDTTRIHGVDGTMEPRLLITYGFGANFEVIKGTLK